MTVLLRSATHQQRRFPSIVVLQQTIILAFFFVFVCPFTAGAMSSSQTNYPPSTGNNVSGAGAAGLPFPKMLSSERNNHDQVVKRSADHDDNADTNNDNNTIQSVSTKMNYVTSDTIEVNVRRQVDGCDTIYEGATWDPVEVQVENARRRTICQPPKMLHEHGYELVEDSPIEDLDIAFMNTDDVIDKYYPSCERLLQNVLGGPDVVEVVKAFDHNIRISNDKFGDQLKGTNNQAKAQVPLGIVHGDYTKTSGPKRLVDLSHPPKANDVLKSRLQNQPLLNPELVQEAISGKRRFALINVWRNIDKDHAVEEVPLACVDASSVSNKDDLKILNIHYEDRIGQNYFLAYSKSHKWCYFPGMVHKEAMLIKQWDSFGDFATSSNHNRISTFASHSAFADPSSPKNPRPRKSIEVRVAIIWK